MEGTILEVSVPDAKWHDLALYLHNQLHFDYLVSIVGMDWGETLGCVYYLTSTVDNSQVSVKIEAADRENPLLHSVSDIWKSANLYEREVYDFFGIRFINHPDMRRLFLRNDWVGYPFRKDYNADPELNPIRLEHESVDDVTASVGHIPSISTKVGFSLMIPLYKRSTYLFISWHLPVIYSGSK